MCDFNMLQEISWYASIMCAFGVGFIVGVVKKGDGDDDDDDSDI